MEMRLFFVLVVFISHFASSFRRTGRWSLCSLCGRSGASKVYKVEVSIRADITEANNEAKGFQLFGGDSIEADTDTANIDKLVGERTEKRRLKQYIEADKILKKLKDDYRVCVTDNSYDDSEHPGLSTWDYIVESDSNIFRLIERISSEDMDLATKESLVTDELIGQIETNELKMLSSRELTGRKFADAALALALAGVSNKKVYYALIEGAKSDLARVGHRNSCRSIDLLDICRTFSAAGVEDQEFYLQVAEIIDCKIKNNENQEEYENQSFLKSAAEKLRCDYNMFIDERALCLLWRKNRRGNKAGLQRADKIDIDVDLDTTSNTSSKSGTNIMISDLFENPELPLIVDLGCGLGLSMLGLAYSNRKEGEKFNFLGVDMSESALQYAEGISSRFLLQGNCRFLKSEALLAVYSIQSSYRGDVQWYIVSFPTPYHINNNKNYKNNTVLTGNTQLPNEEKFMFSVDLVRAMEDSLLQYNKKTDRRKEENSLINRCRGIFFQSNAEDVSLHMKKIIEDTCSNALNLPDSSEFQIAEGGELCKWVEDVNEISKSGDVREGSRLNKYLKAYSEASLAPRAIGEGWLSRNPFPFGKTETETACELLLEKSVYRCLFIVE